MIIISKIGAFVRVMVISITLLVIISCDPEVYDGIPYAFVEIDINLNLTTYFDLQRDGGFVYIIGGLKGIILYRENENTYRAFEQSSPVNPTAACAIVEVDESQLFLIDRCSNAVFDFEGNPTNGVSAFPLKQYITILEGNWLYIRSE